MSDLNTEVCANWLIAKITKWSQDRKITDNATPLAQLAKLMSEVGELSDNVAKKRDVRDDIGDCVVVLNILANMHGYSLNECIAVAYHDIKNRRGHLNEHGVFIKEGDEPEPPVDTVTG